MPMLICYFDQRIQSTSTRICRCFILSSRSFERMFVIALCCRSFIGHSGEVLVENAGAKKWRIALWYLRLVCEPLINWFCFIEKPKRKNALPPAIPHNIIISQILIIQSFSVLRERRVGCWSCFCMSLLVQRSLKVVYLSLWAPRLLKVVCLSLWARRSLTVVCVVAQTASGASRRSRSWRTLSCTCATAVSGSSARRRSSGSDACQTSVAGRRAPGAVIVYLWIWRYF